MKIIGIDPASGKNSTVFDGKDFHSFTSVELGEYLKNLKKEEKHVLICWDSPLTGPPLVEALPPLGQVFANNKNRELTFREVEKFYSNKKVLNEKGVNVQGYYGCSHWTISRHLLGLPIMGEFDRTDNLPFKLIFSLDEIKEKGHYITETHPALAMYIWFEQEMGELGFQYKGAKKNNEVIPKILELLKIKFVEYQEVIDKIGKDDDKLDAFVCFLLANEWINANTDVGHIGNAASGSFLLPNIENQKNNFLDWKKSNS